MLKTTTETGDLGEFAITSAYTPRTSISRKLHSLKSMSGVYDGYVPRSPEQGLHLHNIPNMVDDRKRLPSYTRDVCSETASLYPGVGSNLPRNTHVSRHAENRSHSMTQTSTHTLHSQHSYASLKSQPDGNIVHQPRSPFPYPSRLKRPGFGPSTPVLISGGAVCESRRAETEKQPEEYDRVSSTNSALYTQKISPPSSRPESRTERIGSNFFQRDAASPAGINSKDFTYHPSYDRERRPGSSSPARSTLSLASTTNMYQLGLATPSTSTTPGGLHASSPLYYDYTEDFDNDIHEVDNIGIAEPRLLPPPFVIDKTIHEDRELSMQQSLCDISVSKAGDAHSEEHFQDASNENQTHQVNGGVELQHTDPISLNSSARKIIKQNVQAIAAIPSSDCYELEDTSQLGAVHETSGGNDSLGLVSDRGKPVDASQTKSQSDQGISVDLNPRSDRSSSYTLVSQIPLSPDPGANCDAVSSNIYPDSPLPGGLVSEHNFSYRRISTTKSYTQDTRIDEIVTQLDDSRHRILAISPSISPDILRAGSRPSVLTHDERECSSGVNSLDHGLTDLAKLISDYRSSNNSNTTPDNSIDSHGCAAGDSQMLLPQRIVTDPPILPHPFMVGQRSISSANTSQDLRDQKKRYGHEHRFTNGHALIGATKEGESFTNEEVSRPSHEFKIPRKPIPQLNVLAPKPISPVRELRLKNSIPRLMKALPPLPIEHQVLDSQNSRHPSESFRPSEKNCSWPKTSSKASLPRGIVELDALSTISRPRSHGRAESIKDLPPYPPPRLRLKVRSYDTLRPESPMMSRPWNIEDNYPWNQRPQIIRLPSVISEQDQAICSPSKLRLKTAKPQVVEPETVRIKRDASTQNTWRDLNLLHPKDLFSSTSSLTGIFREFGSHSNPKHPGFAADSATVHAANRETFLRVPTASTTNFKVDTAAVRELRLASTPCHTQPADVRSFFSDDSSQIQGSSSLRKRISNLRALIPAYMTPRSSTTHPPDDDILGRRTTTNLEATGRSELGIKAPDSPTQASQRGRLSTPTGRGTVGELCQKACAALNCCISPNDK